MPNAECRMLNVELTSRDARRLALGALGFGARKPARATAAHVRATADRLGAIQIDSVNVLARAHYMPTFSRYGPYSRTALDELAYRKRELFEYWGHASCFLPVELFPLLQWRMKRQVEAWSTIGKRQRDFNEAVYREVADRGPIAAGDISIAGKSTGPWWGWSEGKRAVEFLFNQGRVAVASRRHFQRLYDITERVIPDAVRRTAVPATEDAQKALIVRAARAMGVGTAKQILQYFHIDSWWDRSTVNGRRKPARAGLLVEELVEEGRLVPARVDGWPQAGYLAAGARIPRSIDVRAIVSPFDPLLWERQWTSAVFGFDYQIEIYVPAPRRIFGYYVLPFLMGDQFAARVDLKADRRESCLLVHAAYVEPHAKPAAVAAALADELQSMAGWLALDRIAVTRKGNLSAALKRALGN
jgi:uncharacterized protein YcaQ